MADTIQIPGYEILRPLGSGGMSTVYLALQRSLDRNVALKVMRRSGDMDSADSRQLERRFLLEGRMMAKLPHRNIAAVYDIVSNDTIAYIAMEYLVGGALTDRMRSGIDLADAVSVIVQIAGALEFAHSHGVVHRDLKPANIMFRDGGTPVLTDFGIARYQDGSAVRLTQTGMLVGTPTYMSPEQINGIAVDGRADQYSLGILFYELLTGQPPFRGDTPIAVLMAHLTQQAAPLPVEFRSFQELFDRVLAKDREARYPNLQEFAEALKTRLVNSDTLLMRLQLDPDQTSSEQLRALGFHTSTPGAGGLRETLGGRLANASGPRSIVKPLQPPAKPVVPAQTPGASTVSSRKLLWPAVAAIAVLVIAGLAWFLWAGKQRPLSADDRDLVAFWLDRAEQHVQSNELVVAAQGSEGSAFQFVQKVLQKDPGNSRAQEMLDKIAHELGNKAEAALTEARLDAAAELDDQGLLVRPDDSALKALKARIADARGEAARKVAEEKQAAEKQAAETAAHEQQALQAQQAQTAAASELRERIGKVLAAGAAAPAADLRAAVADLGQLYASEPAGKETLALRARVIDAIGTRLQKAADTTEFDGWARLVSEQRKVLESDPAFATLTKAAPAWRAKVVAAEQEQEAALRGELVINAQPWGTVESVLDANRQPVKLPADASTPLTLSVPAGSYVVTIRHPRADKPTQVIAKVEAKKRANADAAFPTISAQEYFSRAGW